MSELEAPVSAPQEPAFAERPLEVAESPPHPKSSIVREYFEAVLVAVTFALFVRTFLFQAFQVPTPSMEKNILIGDHLIVNKFLYAPRGDHFLSKLLPYREVRPGDVVVFKFPEDPRRDFVKRAVAIPGQTVTIRDKALSVDGVLQKGHPVFHFDPRIWPNDASLPDVYRRRDQYGPVRIPPGSYFALGDNRDSSYDSRFWGPVPAANLKGRALFIYWSYPMQEVTRWSPREILRLARNFFRKTRWERIFRPVR